MISWEKCLVRIEPHPEDNVLYFMKGKRKKIILAFVILLVIASGVYLFLNIRYDSRSGMPPLTDEDLVEAGRSGHYPHLLIHGSISSASYMARFDIYKNGTGRLYFHWFDHPEFIEQDMEDTSDENGEILPGWEWYREFIDNFQSDPMIADCYKVKLSVSDIKSILTALGDGTIDYEGRAHYSGEGVGYNISIAMGGKKTHFSAVSHGFDMQNQNLELCKWMVSELIPLLRDNGEVITHKEYKNIEKNYLLLHGFFNPAFKKQLNLPESPLPEWTKYLFQD